MQTAQKMFELHSEYKPTGDQPQAIEALVGGFREKAQSIPDFTGGYGFRQDLYHGQRDRTA